MQYTPDLTNNMRMELPFFVYGTLRPNCGNDRRWHGLAMPYGDGAVYVRGFRLVGRGFPYAIPADADTWTTGCLIVPTPGNYDEVRRGLDQLEGLPHHYSRHITAVYEGPNDQLPMAAWIYVPADVDEYHLNMAEVPGNDWHNAISERIR